MFQRGRSGRTVAVALPALMLWLIAALAAVGVGLTGCTASDEAHRLPDPLPATPAQHIVGEQLYTANCAGCHGEAAGGTAEGPPLVHPYYEPGHHSDAAFLLAVRAGVRAHHWRFGDMPPQPQVSDEEAARITGYLRWLQRLAGIH